MAGARPPVAGRADEIAVMLALVRDAVGGAASAVLVSGEPGVGKTSLVRHACQFAPDRIDVVWASCLPLTSLATPLLPLRSALPDPSIVGGSDPVFDVDAWLDRSTALRPVLLVVDDVQWADDSTLDVLMYVLAGRPDRGLGVAVTLRTGGDAVGHRLHRWLADVRRLPRVRELPLGRLDRSATRDQIGGLFGQPPFEALVDEVYARTDGNPYLTSLLVRGVAPDAVALPSHLPGELRDALARAWHGLSGPARELTSVIAVAGRPQRVDQLRFGGGVVPLLRESVEAGVLRCDPAGRYWFTHPMLAEVLVDGLLPEERRALHAAFAATLAPRGGEPDGMGVDEMVNLADHYYRAGMAESAFRWALSGAQAARATGGSAEALQLLRRAFELWPEVAEPGMSRAELLRRMRVAAREDGRQFEELAAIEQLLAQTDRGREPLIAAELMVSRMRLRFITGIEYPNVGDVAEAVRISAVDPSSPEHALATAELAGAMLWHEDPAGVPIARRAVALARRCGSDRALVWALIADVMAHGITGDYSHMRQALHARAIAARLGDFAAYTAATYCASNSFDAAGLREVMALYREAYEELVALDAPHAYVSEMMTVVAGDLSTTGDWRGCLTLLRVALGVSPGRRADTRARLTAALLACRQGRAAEADAHLARAEELFGDTSDFLVFNFDAVRAELAAAAGDTERAVACALTGLGLPAPPLEVERLLPVAERALADLAETYRDRHEDPAPALTRLHDLRQKYPRVVVDTGGQNGQSTYYLRVTDAMQQLTDAETARARSDPDEAARWQQAAELCHDAELRWDEAYCRWRQAQTSARDRTARRETVVALRQAYELAVDLQAAPIITDLTALARTARIPLLSATAPEPIADQTVPGLTPREREILAHIVAGRTYAEIAHTLVLSEKTISVHVSNMLRKTNAANRIELAQLARRLQIPDGQTASD